MLEQKGKVLKFGEGWRKGIDDKPSRLCAMGPSTEGSEKQKLRSQMRILKNLPTQSLDHVSRYQASNNLTSRAPLPPFPPSLGLGAAAIDAGPCVVAAAAAVAAELLGPPALSLATSTFWIGATYGMIRGAALVMRTSSR